MAIQCFQLTKMPTMVNVHVYNHRPMAGTTAGIEEHAFKKGFTDPT